MAIGSWSLEMNSPSQVYQRGLEERSYFPLHSGLYKLREVTDHMKSYLNEVRTIEKHKKDNLQLPLNMRHCTREDAHIWLKCLPFVVAHDLGYNALPAVMALQADGISPSNVTYMTEAFKKETQATLYLCDKCLETLQLGINAEYRDMKSGRSNMIALLECVVGICEDALRTVTQLKSTP